MKSFNYADFDLEISRLARGKYQARVIDSPSGQAVVEFKRPFTDLEFENFILKMGHTRSSIRSINSPEMQAAKEFGGKLFEAVFQGAVRECLTSSLHQVDRGELEGLRIKLRLVSVPELANIPWEYLYHTALQRFIILSAKTPLVRYLDLPAPTSPLTVASPLRILVVISSPSDYPTLDVEREKHKIISALHELENRGLITIEMLGKPTLSALQQHLRKKHYHVLHFIGHGGWDSKAEDGFLVFEDDRKRGHNVGAQQIATLLHDHDTLRLVILNACEGARSSFRDPFAGVAGTLVQHNIPAVVAMQFEITDKAAIDFAQVFYESLADGYAAEMALAEARKAIYASGNDTEWGTPVLYLRTALGQLFQLIPKPNDSNEDTKDKVPHNSDDFSAMRNSTKVTPPVQKLHTPNKGSRKPVQAAPTQVAGQQFGDFNDLFGDGGFTSLFQDVFGDGSIAPSSNRQAKAKLRGTVSIETLGGIATPLIRKGTSLPASATQVFSTAKDNQAAIEAHLLYGENEKASANISLGKFNFAVSTPAPKAVPQIELQIQIDINHRLTVFAVEQPSGRTSNSMIIDLPQELDVYRHLSISLEEVATGTQRELVIEEEPVTVKVPAGIKTNDKIRLKGRGHHTIDNSLVGDLYFVVNVGDHPLFTRNKNDVYLPLPIPQSLAKSGGKTRIPSPNGQIVDVTIPAGVADRQKIRFKGLGIPDLKDGTQGDFFAVVEIYNPRKVPESMRQKIQLINTVVGNKP
jgi:curved DNA-binding protein CbpA